MTMRVDKNFTKAVSMHTATLFERTDGVPEAAVTSTDGPPAVACSVAGRNEVGAFCCHRTVVECDDFVPQSYRNKFNKLGPFTKGGLCAPQRLVTNGTKGGYKG
jgi:hypothetical protein